MKKFLSSLAAASVLLTATPAIAAPANSVFYFDALREKLRDKSVTNAVLDGSINAEIDRVHPFDRADQDGTELSLTDLQRIIRRQKVEYNRDRNRKAVQEHCKRALRVTTPSQETKCGTGFNR